MEHACLLQQYMVILCGTAPVPLDAIKGSRTLVITHCSQSDIYALAANQVP